jgi:Sulfotransferase family
VAHINRDARALMAEAQRLTGITHIADTQIEEPLTKLLESLNGETQLNAAGAAAMEKRLLRLLSNRLRMERDYRAHPEIEEQQIRKPLFLTGMGRTGSTKLHRMLAASGDFLWLPCWHGHSLSLRSGDRHESPDPRLRDAVQDIAWFNAHAPNVLAMHVYDPFQAEEESIVLEHCLWAPYMAALAFVPSYARWSAQRGFDQDVAFLQRAIKYLQWQFHDGDARPWVFKSPGWPGLEPLLGKYFPDAFLVTTNRHPAKIIPSAASLLCSFHGAWSDFDHRKIMGQMLLEGVSMNLQAHIAGRDAHPELNFLDLAYRDVTENAEAVIARIYRHIGMALSDIAKDSMRKWEKEVDQHDIGAHRYSLEDFGLNAEQTDSKARAYIDRFAHLI